MRVLLSSKRNITRVFNADTFYDGKSEKEDIHIYLYGYEHFCKTMTPKSYMV